MSYRQKTGKKINELNRDYIDMNTPVIPSLEDDDTNAGVITALRVGAAVSQGTKDALASKGVLSALAAIENTQTGWDGLTADQEIIKEQQRRQAEIDAEWQRNLDHYDEMIRDVDEQLARLDTANKELDSRALKMSSGKLAYKIGPHQYVYIDEHGNETIITDPEELKEAERLDKENQQKGIQTADASTKIDIIKQGDALRAKREQLLQEKAEASASAGPHDQKQLNALSTQTAKQDTETRALLDQGEAQLAASNQVSAAQKQAFSNEYDDDGDDPSPSATVTGRTGTVAEQISASPTPGKGTAVQAFALNASPPVSSAPTPVVTTTPDPSVNKNPVYSNGAPQ